MKHYFFWQHEYIPVKIEHIQVSAISTLTERELSNDIPATQILRKCKCGKLKTEIIKGQWLLEDIK